MVITIVATAAPFAYYAFNSVMTNLQLWPLPRGPLTDAVVRMTSDYGYGTLLPYRVLLVPPAPVAPGAVLTQVRGSIDNDMYRASCRVAQ